MLHYTRFYSHPAVIPTPTKAPDKREVGSFEYTQAHFEEQGCPGWSYETGRGLAWPRFPALCRFLCRLGRFKAADSGIV